MENILMICCDGLENGGIQAVIMSIIENIYKDYHIDIIVFSKGNQFYTEKAKEYGCNITYIKPLKANNIVEKIIYPIISRYYYKKKFKEYLKDKKGYYKVIHCHNYFRASSFVAVAKKYKIPIRIVHSHNVDSPIKRKNKLILLENKIDRTVIKKNATKLIACSKASGQYLFNCDNATVINNAINLEKFSPQKYEYKSKSRISFIHVGRYSFQKNQMFLLDVFYNIKKSNKNAELTLIGFGELEEQIKGKIKNLKLEDSVLILPHDSDIPYELSKADAMIFPSTYEGLGISVIEAQAMGLKCYTSDVIQPEADLGLCKKISLSLSAEQWAKIILEDIKKNGLDKKIVDMSAFDIKNVIKKYKEIYSGI